MVNRVPTESTNNHQRVVRSPQMITLGIVDSKPAAAAILIDGNVVAAVAEERLCRMKMARGMPLQAIPQVLALAGLKPSDIDEVAVAQFGIMWVPKPLPWDGWFAEESLTDKRKFSQLGAQLAPIVGRIPFAPRIYTGLKAWLARGRQTLLPDCLQTEYGINAPVTFYDHHYCHATAAYASTPFGQDDVLVVTLDGGGDGLSGTVYAGRDGKLTRLHQIDSFHSIGNLYSYITALCGYKAEKHEGKITGLAAMGNPIYADILRQFVEFRRGTIQYRVPMYRESALKKLRQALPDDANHADLAASVQHVLEDICGQFVTHWVEKTGITNVAAAGGVFANVKLNQHLYQLPCVKRLFVYPAMSDDGLAIGSALAAEFSRAPVTPRPIPHMYLGNSYTNDEIAEAIATAGLNATHHEHDQIHTAIADQLAAGHVVARFTGGMEFGPRALGHRSILYRTDDPSVNAWLNHQLNRTEFMPFAPATLIEHANFCYLDYEGAADSARFMTITFDCTEQMKAESPGTVHVDGTARPQLVSADTAPDFHAILTAYHARTGNPSLINTSFNLHGEPIVCTPDDAIRSFQQGELDYLAIGNWLIAHSTLQSETEVVVHGAVT